VITTFASWPRRRRFAVAGLAVATVVVVAVILFLRASSSPQMHSTIPSASSPATLLAPFEPGPASPSPSGEALPPLRRTDDPVTYARDVAIALFGVRPAAVTRAEFLLFWQGELPTVVYCDAGSKGLTLDEQNGDALDNLTSFWIPQAAAWTSEASEWTSNRFTITSVSVPDYWVNSVADGTFRDPGLHMERVMGVLTQVYGADPAHRYTSSRSVVIDLGLLCGPTQPDGCRLLAPQKPPGLGNS
jgi:hypothetical protein